MGYYIRVVGEITHPTTGVRFTEHHGSVTTTCGFLEIVLYYKYRVEKRSQLYIVHSTFYSILNTKTNESNSQVIARMEQAFINNIENADSVTNSNVIDNEMKKLILKRGKQIFSRKTVNTKEFLTYVDQIAAQLELVQSV